MITVTESAVTKIQDILAEENNPGLKLRVFVQGGGCSGMSYGFTLDEQQNDDDWNLEISGVQVLVDAMSGGYLQGAEIDYQVRTLLAKSPSTATDKHHCQSPHQTWMCH